MFGKFYIGGKENPYMIRWFLIPRNRFLNVYLHKFCRHDEDRALHDHPWWFLSFMIWGRYEEHTEDGIKLRIAPSIAFRKATHRHRVSLLPSACKRFLKPAWTIVITGPRIREWGFWCPKGFVHWKEFVDSSDEGNIGKVASDGNRTVECDV